MAVKRSKDEADPDAGSGIPGTGPTMTVSASLHAGTVEAVRSRVGRRGFSSYLEAALRRQIEQDMLTELVNEHIRMHGDFTAEEMAKARADLYGTEPADVRRAG